MAYIALIIGILAFVASLMGTCGFYVEHKPRHALACAAAMVAALVLLVFSVGSIVRDERDDRIRGAQACVDAGGTPFRATRMGGVTCLYGSQR